MPTLPHGVAALLLAVSLACPPSSVLAREAPFHFELEEGRNVNFLIREGKIAAHVVLRSGQAPRILVAFPAGNSGVGLWFQPQEAGAHWVLEALPTTRIARDSQGRPLYGVAFDTSIAIKSLVPKQAILSSIRILRDYESSGAVPEEVVIRPEVSASRHSIVWSRNRLDGAAGYRLTLEVIDGTSLGDGRISAGPDGRIKLHIVALSGEVPLTPLSGSALLNGKESHDERARDTLTFLSYEEKFLAGSWRFNTYFGRDTLLSIRLLMPVLAPDAIEAGLRAVLARLASDGEVAHEEGIGEFAVLSHKRQDGTLSDAPIFDYAMIDGNYLLAPIITSYLLDDPVGKRRAAEYLRNSVDRGGSISAGQALLRNLRLVATSAAKFAAEPRYRNLISLKPGRSAGEWRDSQDGIGGGRYPYDVNAVLVPAALEATTRLLESGLLDPFLAPDDREILSRTAEAVKVWRTRAPVLFDMTVDNHTARTAIDSYAAQIGVPAAGALAALATNAVGFHAISLDADGKPVPIVHSDEGFELLFARPDPSTLDRDVRSVVQPFPLGLMTGAGMLVANPAFAAETLKAKFSNHAYHGTVVWSWQQALFASGLERQLQRTDLPKPVRQHLLAAQQTLWQVIRATRSMRTSELWSWRFESGHYSIAPFGASGTDADESNAAQLWSSVYLAVRPPKRAAYAPYAVFQLESCPGTAGLSPAAPACCACAQRPPRRTGPRASANRTPVGRTHSPAAAD